MPNQLNDEELILEEWGGFNDQVDPVTLGNRAMRGLPVQSPNMQDFYGHGDYVQRRPALVTVANTSVTTPSGGPAGNFSIVDLINLRISESDGVNSVPPSLFGLIAYTTGVVGPYNWPNGFVNNGFIGAGAGIFIYTNNRNSSAKLTQVSDTQISIPNLVGGSFIDFLVYLSWQYGWQYTGSIGVSGFPFRHTLLHQGYVFKNGRLYQDGGGIPYSKQTIIWSGFQNAKNYSSSDNFDLNNEGAWEALGCYTDGEREYIGSNRRIFLLAGASPQRFRLIPISLQWGIAGMRAAARIAPGTMLAILCEDSEGGWNAFDTVVPRNIGILTSEGVQEPILGNDILSAIRNGYPTAYPSNPDVSTESRVSNFTALTGAIVQFRNRDATTGKTNVMYWSKKGTKFWPWVLGSSSGGPSCYAEKDNILYAGMSLLPSGVNIAQFDDTQSADSNGGAFSPFWDSPEFVNPDGTPKIINAVTVWAKQTSGSVAWKVQRYSRGPGGSGGLEAAPVPTAGSPAFVPTSTTSAFRITFTGSSDTANPVGHSYVNQFRLTQGSDSVKGRFMKIVVEFAKGKKQ